MGVRSDDEKRIDTFHHRHLYRHSFRALLATRPRANQMKASPMTQIDAGKKRLLKAWRKFIRNLKLPARSAKKTHTVYVFPNNRKGI